MLLNKDSTQVGGGKSTYAPKKSGGSSSYSNKRLDNYKKKQHIKSTRPIKFTTRNKYV